jgi:hypothetical protein
VGGTYTQTAGTTTINGLVTSTKFTMNIDGGTLLGDGTVDAIVNPPSAAPPTLHRLSVPASITLSDLTYDLPAVRSYLDLDAEGVTDNTLGGRLLTFDGGVAARPFPLFRRWNFESAPPTRMTCTSSRITAPSSMGQPASCYELTSSCFETASRISDKTTTTAGSGQGKSCLTGSWSYVPSSAVFDS